MILRIEREWPCGYPGWFGTLPVEQQARILGDRRQTQVERKQKAAKDAANGKHQQRPKSPRRRGGRR